MRTEPPTTLQRINATVLAVARSLDYLLDRFGPLCDRLDAAEGNETAATMLRELRRGVVAFVREATVDLPAPVEGDNLGVAIVVDREAGIVRLDCSQAVETLVLTPLHARQVAAGLIEGANQVEGTRVH